MSAEPISRPADSIARSSRQMAINGIDKEYVAKRDEIRASRDNQWEAAITRSVGRTRLAMQGLDVTEDGRLTGDPAFVAIATADLIRELRRAQHQLTAVQTHHERQVAAAKANRDELVRPFEFDGAAVRPRLTVLSPNTAQEA